MDKLRQIFKRVHYILFEIKVDEERLRKARDEARIKYGLYGRFW